MKLLALEAQPERGDWTESLLGAIQGEFDGAMELVTLLTEHLSGNILGRACDLVGTLHEQAAAQRQAFERELRWRTWVMARYYFKLTGNHVETGRSGGKGQPKVDGNIYDISEMLIQKKVR